jgi:DNA recombination protein RmuC
MILNLILIALVIVTAIAGWRMALAAHARGRREVELEAAASSAPLRERADDLAARLASAEARVENAEKTFREMQKQRGELEATAARVPVLEAEIATLRTRADGLARELAESGNRNAGLDAALREIRAREPELKEALAAFLQEKGQGLTKHNAETLKAVLEPLQTRIQEFEKKVDEADKSGLTRHAELKTQIEGLLGMNQRLSAEAHNLTLALKGENKTGGNWGELILERVLESSGLGKDREYRIQPSYAGEDGRQQPDIVIDLPDNRHLVVDSKLSLVAYERYCNANTSEEADLALDAHVQSVRQHVEQLSNKKYHEIYALNSVDFVFLFMPLEPAFIEAAKRDATLFQTAFTKNIVIVSPSTLLATLRTVASIWRQEKQNRNVREIARQAGALYAKFTGFLGDLDKVEKALGSAQESFGAARSKLATGKGNLVISVEKLKALGAKVDKAAIPVAWLQEASAADDLLGDSADVATNDTLPLTDESSE